MYVAEMCIPQYMSEASPKVRIKNTYIKENLGVADFRNDMKEHQLWWLNHIIGARRT